MLLFQYHVNMLVKVPWSWEFSLLCYLCNIHIFDLMVFVGFLVTSLVECKLKKNFLFVLHNRKVSCVFQGTVNILFSIGILSPHFFSLCLGFALCFQRTADLLIIILYSIKFEMFKTSFVYVYMYVYMYFIKWLCLFIICTCIETCIQLCLSIWSQWHT